MSKIWQSWAGSVTCSILQNTSLHIRSDHSGIFLQKIGIFISKEKRKCVLNSGRFKCACPNQQKQCLNYISYMKSAATAQGQRGRWRRINFHHLTENWQQWIRCQNKLQTNDIKQRWWPTRLDNRPTNWWTGTNSVKLCAILWITI